MGKLRLADIFGKSCLMINFIFCKNDGYSSDDIEILQFMLLELLNKVKKSINKLPQKKNAVLGNSLVIAKKTTIIWNNNIAMRLFYASFEIYKFCALLTFVISANLIWLIFNQWVEIQDPMLSLKKLIFLKH